MPNSMNPPSREPRRSASELRLDWITGQYFVLASERENRPNEFLRDADRPFAESCSFCAGREHETTATRFSYPPPRGGGHAHSWQVRVVENIYPIFAGTNLGAPQGVAAAELGLEHRRREATGDHFVLIESPLHRRQLIELQPVEVATIFRAYRDQIQQQRRRPNIESVLLFKNSGRDAGMSREHLHSQVIAWPYVPPILAWEVAGARRFFESRGECVFCALLAECVIESSRAVHLGDSIAAFCPYASRSAYEICVMPRTHAASFDLSTDDEIDELASVFYRTLMALNSCLGPVAYNYLLHTIPFHSSDIHQYHWHFEIIPRLNRLAGLEWGSGMLLNTVAPEHAAAKLRAAMVEVR